MPAIVKGDFREITIDSTVTPFETVIVSPELAVHLGVEYEAAKKARQRAIERLALAIRA